MNYKNIDPQSIAVAIITYYPQWYRGKLRSIKHTDKVRGDLALDFINKAKKFGFQVVAVDGKSSRTFRKSLLNIEGIITIKRRGKKRSPAKRQAFKIASKLEKVKVIIATEAEKVSLIDYVKSLVEPILDDQAEIIIPKRDPNLFKTSYPAYQYESEVQGNILYNQYLKVHGYITQTDDFDFFFGPRVFKNDPKIVALFLKQYRLKISKIDLPNEYFDSEQLSNTVFFPIVLALKKRLRIKSITVPFLYPRLQKDNEEYGNKELFLEKRNNQRMALLIELMYFIHDFQH